MDNKLYFSMLAALATMAAVVLLALLAAPIAKPLAWALILGISTMPHHNRLLKHFPGRPGRAAGLMILAVTICFVLPVVALVATAVVNAPDWYHQVQDLVNSFTQTGSLAFSQFPFVDRIMDLVKRFGVDLAGVGGKAAATASTFVLNAATSMARNLFDFAFTLAVALFLLFFIYRDGEKTVSVCIGRLAPNPRRAQRLASRIRSVTTAVTVGTLLTCATQGVIAGLGYWVAGVPAPIFCGTLTAIAALVPVVGTAVVWVPLVVVKALGGDYTTAVLLALWCLVFVGFADNAIRPLAVGASSDVSVLAVVVGAICGMVMMGLLGLIVGPVVFAILFSLWEDTVVDVEPVEHADVP